MIDSASISQRLAELSPAKREMLKKLLETKARGIRPRDPQERIPLTYSQQRLWLVDQLLGGTPAYNESNFIRLPYALDVGAFRRAFNEVIRRHESLRTVFEVVDGEPVQRVKPSLVLEIPLADLRHLPAEAREQEAMRLAAEEGRIPVKLDVGPLLRGKLYRLGDSDYLFALMMHHIICDGWSMSILGLELSALYWSFMTGSPSPLPELKIQYPDFAVWQRRALNDKTLAPQIVYWRERLADLPALDLSTDRPRPAEFSHRGARRQLVIPPPLHRALSSLCEREGITPNVLLLAALYALLHRYSGQTDIAVGSAVGGRNREEIEPIIGFFINMLVLRADLSGDPTFLELLARAREVAFSGYANQDMPFERLVEELQIPRDTSRNPMVQVVLQMFQTTGGAGADINPELLFPFFPVDSSTAKFDLLFQLQWHKDNAGGYIEYSTDLFDASRIERMATHFDRLLQSAAADPTQPLSKMRVLTEEEERRLLFEWNATTAEYPRDSSIPAEFEAQARSAPDRTAVLFAGRSLTYRELDDQAELLAGRLAALGVRRGDRVGLFMERCLELPAALLGIAKAGAISVPLDPQFPAERLSYLISDSGAQTVVTTSRLRDGLAGLDARAVDVEEALGAEERPGRPGVGVGPADVACLLYTSGTTGLPKAVAVTHGGVLRLVKGVHYVSFSADETVLQFAALTFDAATFEIWGSLLNGCKLVIHPPGMPSLDELGAFIKESGVTFLFLTTSLWRQMAERNAADLRSVRQLITGGEVMPAGLAKALWKQLPRTRIVNLYGPTECTTAASTYTITNAETIGDNVPIGRPIQNTSFFILDKHGNPVPVGVPGEIFIGGDGVTRGYWNRPGLTAESFVPDPYSGRPGARLYRTGDIGKYREDGNILFLGRRDRQVKLSGYRIELAEVEAAIASHPGVAGVAVMLDGDGDRRLTAFVELMADQRLTPGDLREYLSVRLPHYMVPAQVDILDELPLTSSGKINYQALAGRERAPSPARDEYVAPRTAVEKHLAEIWKRILRVEKIGVTYSFFDLGGHSLVATRLLSRVRETLHAEITMRQFFDDPTVAGLAAIVSQDERQVQRAELLTAHGAPAPEQTGPGDAPAGTTS